MLEELIKSHVQWTRPVLGGALADCMPHLTTSELTNTFRRIQEEAPTMDPFLLDEMSQITSAMPGQAGEQARNALLRQALKLAPEANPFEISALGAAVNRVEIAVKNEGRTAVARRALELIPIVNVQRGKESWDIRALASVMTKNEFANHLLGLLDKLTDFSRIKALDEALQASSAELEPETLVRILKHPFASEAGRRQFLSALQTKLTPADTHEWTRPWQFVDWLESHREESRELRELDRTLHDSLAPEP
jgi:hypothetical protein